MLPPVASSQPTIRPVQGPDVAVRNEQARTAVPDMVRMVRPEMPTAVDAARRASGMDRVREDGAAPASGAADEPPPDDAPTGPPPTFDETPLQRQARVALEPPMAAVDPEVPEDDADNPTAVIEGDSRAGEPESAPAVDATAKSAAAGVLGFTKAAADFAPITTRTIDQKA